MSLFFAPWLRRGWISDFAKTPQREENDLRVLSAEFHRRVRVGIKFADRSERRLNFLHEIDLGALGKPQPRRTCDARLISRGKGTDLLQFAQNTFPHARKMPLVRGIENGPVLIDHADLYRCRAYVDPK